MSGDIVPEKKKMADGDGLYIQIRQLKNGAGIYWRYDFTFLGKRKTLTIGTYPLITVTAARQALMEAKISISKGIDPASQKRAMRISQSDKDNFKVVARAWLANKEGGERHKDTIERYFVQDIFPILGDLAIDEVKSADIVKAVRRLSDRGSYDQARRLGRWLYHICRYAMTVGMIDRNPADIDISMIIPQYIPESHAAITDPVIVGQLLKDIEFYSGKYIVKCMLKLAALMMIRPHNLVAAEWSEVDFDKALWTIQARKLKLKQHIKKANRVEDWHIVPLSTQAVQIFRELQKLSVDGQQYVFPNQRNPNKGHMVTDTIRMALRILGYDKDVMSGHGFRAMARTMIEEQLGIDEKIIEMQLGHHVKSHSGAYDRTKHLEQRAKMLQVWADYLDELRAS